MRTDAKGRNAKFVGSAVAVSSGDFFHKVSVPSLNLMYGLVGIKCKEIDDDKARRVSAQIKNRCRTDLACCEARGWCHSGCWPPYLFQLTTSAQSALLLLH